MINLKDKNLYYVGGCVRDEIIGVPSYDIDLCYEGNAIKFAENLNVIKTNTAFGTVRIDYDGQIVDIASTREECYPKPGHLPEVTNIGCPLEKDLLRRDFTINAIAKNTVSGEYSDFLGGLDDIKQKTLRVLHKNSFKDDPTRIIRGLKFSVRFGFDMEKETLNLQNEYLQNINYDMSYHRIKKELTETFNLNIGAAFDKFKNQGIYKLLGKNQEVPEIEGSVIEQGVNRGINRGVNKGVNKGISPGVAEFPVWIVYMSFFDLSALPLTRAEKRILECSEKLKTQPVKHDTPEASRIIYELKKEML